MMRLKVRQDAARVVLAGLAASLVLASSADATTLPTGFEERALATGLTAPTTAAWAPDGRMFIAEKAGRVQVVSPQGVLGSSPVIDISSHVNSWWDRGLLGIAVDSDFASNRYLYLLYTYESAPGDPSGPKSSRLTRVVVNPDNTVANPSSPETVLLGTESVAQCPDPANDLDCIPSDSFTHSIGTVRSDPDGTLWVGSGDGADTAAVENFAFRSLDERSYAGKIVHVDRNGRGLPGHPFCPSDTNLDHVCAKVYAKGFRNPFRFSLRPGKAPILGDVGWDTREEIDVLKPGGDYGWPCYEGTIRTPSYSSDSRCAPEYAKQGTANAAQPPIYDYAHQGSNAIVAGPVYTGTDYPAGYRGSLFFGDYAKGFVKRLALSTNDRAVGGAQSFAGGWPGVSLEAGPDGNLVSVYFGDGSPGTGSVEETVYSPGNATPVARASASPTSGSGPLEVQFRGDLSTDADKDRLSYRWDFGDGSPASTAANPVHTYASRGDYVARLTVDDGRGRQSSQTVRISVDNMAPTVTISSPADGAAYRDGQSVKFAGSATDAEDGTLPSGALSWHVILRHKDHVHPVADVTGEGGAFTTLRDHDADSHYELTLSATDSRGVTTSRTVVIRPRMAGITLASSPEGAPVSYGGLQLTAPFTHWSAVGFVTSVSAEERFGADGRTYAFARWSDGGARLHELEVPDSGMKLVAIYHDVTPASSVTSSKSAPSDDEPSSSSGDERGPLITFSRPRPGPIRVLRGTARDKNGVRRLWVGLRRRGSHVSRRGTRTCRWWSRRHKRLVVRSCGRAVWLRARLRRVGSGKVVWRVKLGRPLPPGRFRAYFRAVDAKGNVGRGARLKRR
jgi:glucose/arabinose dehydrogenase/PKD repeat protein